MILILRYWLKKRSVFTPESDSMVLTDLPTPYIIVWEGSLAPYNFYSILVISGPHFSRSRSM